MTRLILIPGLAGDATMWRDQLPALPAAWSAEVTDVHQRAENTTITAMARALLAQHTGPLVLCGTSMGGMVAMEAARLDPERVRGLALLGTSARPETEAMRALRGDAVALFAQGRIAEVIAPNVAQAFHPAQAADAALVDRYLGFVIGAGTEQLIRQNRAVMDRPDARPHLPKIACPVLVLCGDSDRLTPPDRSEEIAAAVPGARLAFIERCGHMLTMEKPQEVNRHLVAWLDTISHTPPPDNP